MLHFASEPRLAEKPSDQIIDLAACGGNIVTREIAPNSIPTQIATAPNIMGLIAVANLFTVYIILMLVGGQVAGVSLYTPDGVMAERW